MDNANKEADLGIDRLLTDLFSVGREWATYGLSVGKAALEASAHSLEVTAKGLGDLQSRLETAETAETAEVDGTVEDSQDDDNKTEPAAE